MAEKFDWLVGDYFVYSYADVDTPIEECRASIFKKSSGRLGVHWSIQPGFEYTGQVTVAGGNVNVLSQRTNGEETVLAILQKPNTEYVHQIWGVSAGTSVRGNLPAIFRVLYSRKKLSPAEAQRKFDIAGVNHKTGIMILDYNIEKKNFKPALSSEQIKNISKVLAENSAKKESPNG